VEVYYTCPASDVGSTIELRCGESKLAFQVKEPHDPPLRGQEHDRVPRAESYVKDFKPLDIGTITLEPGPARLELTPVAIPGDTVMDFRLLMFTRID
jgi:hypothetical protein